MQKCATKYILMRDAFCRYAPHIRIHLVAKCATPKTLPIQNYPLHARTVPIPPTPSPRSTAAALTGVLAVPLPLDAGASLDATGPAIPEPAVAAAPLPRLRPLPPSSTRLPEPAVVAAPLPQLRPPPPSTPPPRGEQPPIHPPLSILQPSMISVGMSKPWSS